MQLLARHIQLINARYTYCPLTGELRDRTRNNSLVKSPRISISEIRGGTRYLIQAGHAIYAMVTGNCIPPGSIIRYHDRDACNRKWANLELTTYRAIEHASTEKKSLLEYFEVFHECFDYDDHTGALTWRERPSHHFLTERACKIFNRKYSGKKAGTPQGGDGRLQVHMQYRGTKINAYVSQVVWVMLNRCDPPKGFVVDHRDRDSGNDSKANLRLASPSQNAANMSRAPGISGYRGVYPHGNKFYAQLRLSNPKVSIGKLFAKLEDAVAFRKSLEKKYFGDFRV